MSIHELQAALRALDEARESQRKAPSAHELMSHGVYLAEGRVLEAARRVAEGAGEPVAWQWFDEAEDDWQPVMTEGEAAHRRIEGQRIRPLYTTPPSADALVEALGKLSAEWRAVLEQTNPSYEVGRTVDYLANELDVLIAKHKENTDGR